jgi:hypothetical protein
MLKIIENSEENVQHQREREFCVPTLFLAHSTGQLIQQY